MIPRAIRGAAVPLAAALSVAAASVPGSADAPLPNLTARPAVGIYVELDDAGQDRALRLASDVANTGSSPVEVEPVLEPDRVGSFRQCASWTAVVCDGWLDPVDDGLSLEPGTRCWRIAGLMRYELRAIDEDGRPAAVVAESAHASHWLEDERVNADAPGDAVPRYTLCTLARMGLSPGWVSLIDGDEHGQWLPLDGVADGTYALVSIVDPRGVIAEADEADNVAWLAVTLSGGGTHVEAA